MTQEELIALLPRIKDALGIKKQETFDDYLDGLATKEMADEMRDLSAGVEEEFGVDKSEFVKALKIHLILKAKPWVKEEDVRL